MLAVIRSPRARVGLFLSVVCALILTACGSSSSGGSGGGGTTAGHLVSTTNGQFGTLPAANPNKKPGGTITYAIINGSQPNWILPLTPASNGSIYNQQFQQLMWLPVEGASVSDRPILDFSNQTSLTQQPKFSPDGKTVTFNLYQNYKWSNGQPVTAKDVEFYIDLVKAAIKENASNFSNYTPGDFPDLIKSMSTPSQYTLVLHLDKVYNPNWFIDTQAVLLYAFPTSAWSKTSASGKTVDFTNPANAKKIYDFLASQAKKPSTYDSNPLWQTVDGPFRLTKFNPSTDANTMVPNSHFTGTPKASISQLKAVYFASTTAMFNQLRAGTLNLSAPIDPSDIPQIPQIKRQGYNVWGYPTTGFNYLDFNFKDKTNNWDKVIGQLYIRQALAHLQDENAIIKGVYKGAAAVAYSPVPAIPATAYVPADAQTPPYPFSISAASQLLSSHGWKVAPNGTTTCQSPGTGANQCGAGIPKGQNLNFTVYYTEASEASNIQSQLTNFAGEARKIGIKITPVAKTFNFIVQNYAVASSPANNNKWQAEDFGGFTGLGPYPTMNEIFNTTGSFNEGGFSDKTEDKLIHNSQFSRDPQAVTKEASYITKALPAIFQPNPDNIYAWKGISGPPDSFASLSQYGLPANYWYVTK